MKKKKKNSKKKKNNNKIKVIIGCSIFALIGIFIIIKANSNKYMNNVPKEGCAKGEYFKTIIINSWCEKCDQGSYCPGDNKKYACPNSETTTRGKGAKSYKECNYCKAKGKYYNGTKCVACPKGYYCDDGAKHKCDDGQTTNGTGKKSKSDCYDVKCNKNEYVNNAGQCVICPKDHYCNGKTKTACDNGRVTKNKGQSSSKACICKNGTYDSGYFCIICPAGSYCNNGKENKCPDGYTSAQGKKAKTECYRNVAAGKSIISNKQYKCAKGSYSTVRTVYYGTDSRCTKCPKGTYQDATGQSSCKKCPTDYTSNSGATDKTSCYRTISAGKCLVDGKIYRCSKGSYSTTRNVYYGKNSWCTPCAVGSYQDKEAQSSCKKCSSGYSSKQGASSCYRSSCPAGSYLDSSHSTGCRQCPSGKYCSGGTASPQTCKSGQKVNSDSSGCTNCSGVANCAKYGGNGVTCRCTSCNNGYALNGSGTCTKVTKACANRGTVGECNADGKCKWDYSYGCRNK